MSSTLRKVGRYDVLREVGRGGMATVYLARQSDLDRDVALKELAVERVPDASFVERFLRESRLAGRLTHPNIVTVYEYFEHDGIPYIAMEYLERGSLRRFAGTLTLAQIAGVLEGLLAGLEHAAGLGIVHRDLKPENVMVSPQGTVKIADFGIARALDQASAAARLLTATGTAVGTPTYMAPEQAMAKDVDVRTDLYSVGVIAYELIVGRVPFHDAETPMAMMLRQVSEPIPPPAAVKPGLDEQLSGWIARLLEKDPAARPESALGAWHELEDIVLRLLGPRWRRNARLTEPAPDASTPEPLTPAHFHESVVTPADEATVEPRLVTPPGEETQPPQSAPPLPAEVPPAPAAGAKARAPRRRRLLAGAAIVLVGAAGAAVAIVATGSGPAKKTAPPPPPPPPPPKACKKKKKKKKHAAAARKKRKKRCR
jgi:serine/threonine protein kinase